MYNCVQSKNWLPPWFLTQAAFHHSGAHHEKPTSFHVGIVAHYWVVAKFFKKIILKQSSIEIKIFCSVTLLMILKHCWQLPPITKLLNAVLQWTRYLIYCKLDTFRGVPVTKRHPVIIYFHNYNFPDRRRSWVRFPG